MKTKIDCLLWKTQTNTFFLQFFKTGTITKQGVSINTTMKKENAMTFVISPKELVGWKQSEV